MTTRLPWWTWFQFSFRASIGRWELGVMVGRHYDMRLWGATLIYGTKWKYWTWLTDEKLYDL